MGKYRSKLPDEQRTITLTLEDDSELVCDVVCIMTVGNREYIAVLPQTEGDEEGDVFLYRYKDVDGAPDLSSIEDDEEYDAVSDAFDEYLDEMYFEEVDEREFI